MSALYVVLDELSPTEPRTQRAVSERVPLRFDEVGYALQLLTENGVARRSADGSTWIRVKP